MIVSIVSRVLELAGQRARTPSWPAYGVDSHFAFEERTVAQLS